MSLPCITAEYFTVCTTVLVIDKKSTVGNILQPEKKTYFMPQ